MDRRNKSPQQLSQERQVLLLAVAEVAFQEKGYGGCSIDHIARQSGVSKSTIYRHFSNKEAIFEAVNLSIADEQARLITDFTLDIAAPAKSLSTFSHHIYSIDTQPRFLEAFRLLIAEAGRLPEMTRSVREQGSSKVLDVLTVFFQCLVDVKLMKHPDVRQAAITFYVLARGNFRPLLGVVLDPGDERHRVDVDIAVFLKGVEIAG